jgi:hypothetical protein
MSPSAYPIYSVGRGTDRVSTAQREIHGARAWTASDNRSLTARLRKQSGMHSLGLRYCIARWKAQSVERPGHLLLVRSGSEPRRRGRACNQRKSGSAAESSEVAPASSLVEP